MKRYSIIIFLLMSVIVYAQEIHIYPTSDLQSSLNNLGNGQILVLHAGTYKGAFTISNKNFSSETIIRSAGDGPVVFDGTKNIADIIKEGTSWTHYRDNIYKCELTEDIWQLFLDDELQFKGRWPNVSFDDNSIWDRYNSSYEYDENTFYSFTVSQLINFPAEGRDDFNDAIAVLNFKHWETKAVEVNSINWSTGQFTFSEETESFMPDWAPGENRAYFYGTACIDKEGEWWYDHNTHFLYYYAPEGVNPNELTSTLKGRVRDYSININNSSNITIDGLNLFSSSLAVQGNCDYVIVENCHFLFADEYKIVLGQLGKAAYPKYDGYDSNSDRSRCLVIDGTNCVFRNNVSEYSNIHINLTGPGIIVENNFISHTEWDLLKDPGSGGINLEENATFIYNTVEWGGNSEGIRVNGTDSEFAYNDVSHLSLLQFDGAALNVDQFSERTHVHHNWLHNNGRLSYRWDWYTDAFTHGCVFHHNVSYNEHEDWQIKNDNNVVYNNTCSKGEDLRFFPLRSTGGGYNYKSMAINNVSEHPYNERIGADSSFTEKGGLADKNFFHEGIDFDLLVNTEMLDFRPKPDATELIDKGREIDLSEVRGLTTYNIPVPQNNGKIDIPYKGENPDIGAYEFDDDFYFIPGAKLTKPSVPIPSNGVTDMPLDRDLIFRHGYMADSAKIYFGTKANSLSLLTTVPNTVNVINPSHYGVNLESLTTYYWRVDAVDVSKMQTVTGNVWSFTTKFIPSDDIILATLISDIGTFDPIFESNTLNYVLEIPMNSQAPIISASPQNPLSAVTIVQTNSIPGTAAVTITSQDGTKTVTYNISVIYETCNNLVLNNEFDNSTSNWGKWDDSNAGGNSGISTVTGEEMSGNKALKVTVNSPGSAEASIQVYQNFPIESGKTYYVSFKAKASTERSMQVVFRQNGGSYTSYHTETINLTTTTSEYTYEFNCAITQSETRIMFMLGKYSGDVYIDAIRIAECKEYNTELDEQVIQLFQGWNLISTNVHPADSSIETLFSELDVEIIKTADGFWKTGQTIQKNSLTHITSGEGYLVYMNSAGTLSISGVVETRQALSLKTGWQMVGCQNQTATPFSNDFNSTNTDAIKNFEGFWEPDGTLNSIENLEPGKGYFVKGK